MTHRAIVIGAGPAGLTAAHELARAGGYQVTVLEATAEVGGLSRTVNYKGNRIDIGGHRFFSKSDWVIRWWLDMLPLEANAQDVHLAYQGRSHVLAARSTAPAGEAAMLIRSRLSRIYFGGQFFDYPLKANFGTLRKLGLLRSLGFAASYARAALLPIRPERTLEDFLINRFGRGLYLQFFKSYTEKVWGTSCDRISAEWGAQRIKSLSIGKAALHALRRLLRLHDGAFGGARQTSLVEQFMYPRHGPGQMWEAAATRLAALGVVLERESRVVRLEHEVGRLRGVVVRSPDGAERRLEADHIISTMPVRDLVLGLDPAVPSAVQEVARGLEYRDFITVGLLYRRLLPNPGGAGKLNLVPDNWIYVQEPGVKVGRLQVFNNWSPGMIADAETVWVGLEYFCTEGDEFWRMSDAALRRLAIQEMRQLRLADEADCLDGVVIRMPKAYPGYYGSYARFDEVRRYLDSFENLFLVGRNGMHRYNNQDHSMLSAKAAVEAIISGRHDKTAIWAINVDDEYHEEASEESPASAATPA